MAAGRGGAGAGRLALYKAAQKMHMFQFSEPRVPWSLESWVWELPIVVFQVCAGRPARGRLGHPHSSHLGLHIRGEVQCVPLQFCEGDGGVLQVVEEDLDLWGNGGD